MRTFNNLATGLREENKYTYAFSLQATEELRINDPEAGMFSEQMWDDFWEELQKEYGDNL